MHKKIDGITFVLDCVITYFTPRGKMYCIHDWTPRVCCLNDAGVVIPSWEDAIKQLNDHLDNGNRPGLLDCEREHNEFTIVLRPHDHARYGNPVIICNP